MLNAKELKKFLEDLEEEGIDLECVNVCADDGINVMQADEVDFEDGYINLY